jgi:hypothetical protein
MIAVRRICRILVSGLTICSAVLWITVMVFWVRSYHANTDITGGLSIKICQAWGSMYSAYGALSWSSTLSVGATRVGLDPVHIYDEQPIPILVRFRRRAIEDHLRYHGWSRFGFGSAFYRDDAWLLYTDFVRGYRPPVHYVAEMAAPDWFVLMVLSVLPARWLINRRRRGRALAGGYPIICKPSGAKGVNLTTSE